jgi:hypothetical protein
MVEVGVSTPIMLRQRHASLRITVQQEFVMPDAAPAKPLHAKHFSDKRAAPETTCPKRRLPIRGAMGD